jgi:hypothetical protein
VTVSSGIDDAGGVTADERVAAHAAAPDEAATLVRAGVVDWRVADGERENEDPATVATASAPVRARSATRCGTAPVDCLADFC